MSLKKKFEEIKDKDQNTNLYEHLSNVLTKMLLENPENGYEVFEECSSQVRQSGYKLSKHQEFDNESRLKVTYQKDLADRVNKLMGKKNTEAGEDPQEAGPCGYVPNMQDESKWFEWAGVSFGADETYKIFKSLTQLAVSKAVKSVRLWGKIMCTQRDYYVAEGQADSTAEDGELPPNVEVRGTGINKQVYWVTNDILSENWTELPLLSPHHIEIARKIRYMFTGNLEAKVVSNPQFFGEEKHLLKAQIVRISHSTSITPLGMFTKGEEGEEREVQPTDSDLYKLPGFDQLRLIENWVHLNPAIQKNGRLTHILPQDIEDKNPEDEMKLLELADPYEPRLKPIKQDSFNGSKAWQIRVVGDLTDYNPQAKDQKNKVNYGVVVIKSLVWPGLTNIISNKQWQSLYVGYGFKQSSQYFFPKEPQQIQTEAQDKEEQSEPNFPPDIPNQDIQE